MPNIMLVGFAAPTAEMLEAEVGDIMKDLGLADDSVVTSVTSWVRKCSDNKPEPYTIVRCDNPEHLERTAKAINDKLGLGVEKELINGFLPPNPGSSWNQEGR